MICGNTIYYNTIYCTIIVYSICMYVYICMYVHIYIYIYIYIVLVRHGARARGTEQATSPDVSEKGISRARMLTRFCAAFARIRRLRKIATTQWKMTVSTNLRKPPQQLRGQIRPIFKLRISKFGV